LRPLAIIFFNHSWLKKQRYNNSRQLSAFLPAPTVNPNLFFSEVVLLIFLCELSLASPHTLRPTRLILMKGLYIATTEKECFSSQRSPWIITLCGGTWNSTTSTQPNFRPFGHHTFTLPDCWLSIESITHLY
jgi:hypothetical protein